jgi:hypothetical protein
MTNPWATGRFTTAADLLEQTNDRHELARLVNAMRDDLVAYPNEWENATLERFLDALAALLDSRYQQPVDRADSKPSGPSWNQLARLLVAATGYE